MVQHVYVVQDGLIRSMEIRKSADPVARGRNVQGSLAHAASGPPPGGRPAARRAPGDTPPSVGAGRR
jgi:hypothetical protein